ncbi:MAG: sulfurtransferase [Acidobacteria bacterium]|nr:sulfurtransferase [Acidobacteriota bacterium]MBI3426684.1 sulfurtransferase [Acidobacteriota bacterium]
MDSPPYPNASLLISTTALNRQLDERGLRIIDARSRAEYAAGHVPGALALPVETLRDDTTQRREDPVELALQLARLGLTRSANIVIYDDPPRSQGTAGYIFWTLETLGCSQVALLNGGWPRWLGENRRTTTYEPQFAHTPFDAAPEKKIRLNQKQVQRGLGQPDFALVDVRSDEEYLGWPAPGQTRGGHLPGAVHWPWQWALAADGVMRQAEELKTLWTAHGLTSDKEIALYSNAGTRAGFAYFALRLLGYPRVAVYEGGMNEWSKTEKLPLNAAPRYETIVSAAWVKAVQDFYAPNAKAPRPASYRTERFVILETSWGALTAAKDYNQGHVPGALHLDTDDFENGYPRWHLKSVAALQQVIGRHGITPETTVIVYSQQTIAAARVWWVLNYAGVQDVRFFNGGYQAWQAAGYAGETEVRQPPAVSFSAPPRAEWLATTEYVRANFDNGNVWLADARSEAEYRGEISGYDYMALRGRIPGALPIGDADDKARLYQDHDGTLRSVSEIAVRWAQAGLKAGHDGPGFAREVIFYCGSGWRSSLTFLYAYLLGYGNIRNYSDGWSAWSTAYAQDANEKGITPGWRQTASANPIASGQP